MVNKTTAQKAVVAALSGMMAIAPFGSALAINIDQKPGSTFTKVTQNNFNEPEAGDNWVRLDGDDRYGTMAEIIDEQYTFDVKAGVITRDGVIAYSDGLAFNGASDGTFYRVIDTAIVVSGEKWADALTAASLSGFFRSANYTYSDGIEYYFAPIIITKGGSLSKEAKDALKNLKVERVVILGGTASVSENVENQIKALGLQDRDVIRISGADRVETSVAAFYEMAKRNDNKRMDYDVIIASGKTYADALSIGGAAAFNSVPIILTNDDGELTTSAVQALKNSGVKRALILGGSASVASTTADQLSKIDVDFDRIDGANRYETNWNIVREAYRQNWFVNFDGDRADELTSLHGNLFKAVVASGEVYADALVGAPFSAEASLAWIDGEVLGYQAPIVLVKDGASTLTYLEDNMNEDWEDVVVKCDQYILGGEASVSAKIHDFLEDIDGVKER